MEPKPGTLDYEVRQTERLNAMITIAILEGRFRDAAIAKNQLDTYRWRLRNKGWKSPYNRH